MTDILAVIPAPLWLGYAFAVGATVGSFLNVVIARVPAGESIVRPRSKCPRCQKPIAWFDNIPIVSWMILRAKCRNCGLPISARYPIVEALMGVLGAAIAVEFGASLATLGYFVFASLLVALAYIDLDTWLLPSELTFPLIGVGLLSPLWNEAMGLPMAIFWPSLRTLALAFISSAGGAAAGGLFLAAIAFIGERLGREWMGWGDVWLLAGIGAWLGLPALLPVVMLASVQGAIVGVALLAFGKALGKRDDASPKFQLFEPQSSGSQPSPEADLKVQSPKSEVQTDDADPDDWTPPPTAVPFGPFLVLGALEQLLLGERIWSSWIHLIGKLIR